MFAVKKAVLQPAMQGRARTGTEKTLAFGIPVIDKIIHAKHGFVNTIAMIVLFYGSYVDFMCVRHGKTPLSFVLTPTKDLARQVAKSKEALSLGGSVLNRTTRNPLVTSTAGIHVSGTLELVL